MKNIQVEIWMSASDIDKKERMLHLGNYLSSKHAHVKLCQSAYFQTAQEHPWVCLTLGLIEKKSIYVKISNLLNDSGEKLSRSHHWETEDTPQSSYLQSCVPCLYYENNLTVILHVTFMVFCASCLTHTATLIHLRDDTLFHNTKGVWKAQPDDASLIVFFFFCFSSFFFLPLQHDDLFPHLYQIIPRSGFNNLFVIYQCQYSRKWLHPSSCQQDVSGFQQIWRDSSTTKVPQNEDRGEIWSLGAFKCIASLVMRHCIPAGEVQAPS